MGKLITPKVARDIAKIINDHHAAVAAALFGAEAVDPAAWKLATDLGLVDPNGTPQGIAGELHTFGAFLAHLDQAQRQSRYGDSLKEFKDEIARNPVPQTEAEHHAAQFMRERGAQYIVGLGNKNGHDVVTQFQEQDRDLDKRMRDVIRDVISARFGDTEAQDRMKQLGADEGLGEEFFENEFRKTIKQQVSDIGHATKDWSRDVQRIVQTEGHAAVQEGMKESWEEQEEAQAAEEERSPRRLLAFKLPRPDACPHCNRLHLEGEAPRIFYLDEIVGNGTNVGRKVGEWRVTVGPVHPWCACTLHKVPAMLEMPKGWRSGDAAPSVIGPGGRIV